MGNALPSQNSAKDLKFKANERLRNNLKNAVPMPTQLRKQLRQRSRSNQGEQEASTATNSSWGNQQRPKPAIPRPKPRNQPAVSTSSVDPNLIPDTANFNSIASRHSSQLQSNEDFLQGIRARRTENMNNVEDIGREMGRVGSAHSRTGSANGRRSARRRPRQGAGGAAGPSSGAESGATAQNLTGLLGFTTTATSGPPPGVTAEQLAARQRAQ